MLYEENILAQRLADLCRMFFDKNLYLPASSGTWQAARLDDTGQAPCQTGLAGRRCGY